MVTKLPKKEQSLGTHNIALQISLRDLLNTIFFYRWVWSSVVFGCLVLSALVALVVPPTYRAEARLLTLFAGYYDMQIDRTTNRASPNFDPAQVVNVEAQILSSPELHRTIVKGEVGDGVSPQELDRAIEAFERRFHLEKVDAANLIELSYSDANAQHAADVLNELIRQYYKQRSGVFTQGRLSFLVEQRDKVRQQLDAANAQLVAFQRANDVVNIDSQISAAVALRSLLQQRKLENDSALAQDSRSLTSLAKEAMKVPATIELFRDDTEAAHALDTMQISLLQLKGRRADLASRFMLESPFVQQLDSQINDVQKAVDEQRRSLVSAVRTGHNTYFDTVHDRVMRLSSDVDGENARKGALESQLSQTDAHVQRLIAVASQLHRMEIDRDLLEESFKTFSRQVEQVRIEQNQMDTATSTNVRIIQAPIPPMHRSNPPILFLAAGLVAGLLLGSVTVMVLSSLRETFLSPEEIERSLSLPVLLAPLGTPRAQPAIVKMFRRPANDPGIPRTPRPVDYGRIIMSVNNSSTTASKVVMILSLRDDDGVPPVAQGLVDDLEQRSNRPVLQLDMSGCTDSAADAAVSAVANGSHDPADLLDFVPVPGRRIVVARPKPGVILPIGRQAGPLFEALRREHDFIVVQAPAASRSFIGIETSVQADATLMAIRAEESRKPVALTVKTQIREAGGFIAGVLMTNRQSYIPECIYRFL